MRSAIASILLLVCLVAPCSATAVARASSLTLQCGSYKYGSDGFQPGPSHITALRVSCRVARQVAYTGDPAGWHCKLVEGLRFKCHKGRAVVTFYGE